MRFLRIRSFVLGVVSSAFVLAFAGVPGRSDASPVPTLRAAPDVRPKGHLYVAGVNGSSPYVARFRMSHGVPESTPDRTYSGVGWPIAVDYSGYLYATSASGPSGSFVISVYPPHSNKPVRTLNVQCYSPSCGSGGPSVSGVFSLLVDSQGYLYVGPQLLSGGGGDSRLRLPTRAASRVSPLNGGAWFVYVYAPGSSGNDAPLQAISIGSCGGPFGCSPGAPTGLALDAQANLHVSDDYYGQNDVQSIALPVTNPTLIADLTGVLNPWGLAVDASNELYVENPNGTDSFIAAYPATANGDPVPDWEFTIAGALSFGNGIAAAAGRLFVTDPSGNAVYEVRADKNVRQKPLSVLSVPAPLDAKLGP
jgi:hypothetical protein